MTDEPRLPCRSSERLLATEEVAANAMKPEVIREPFDFIKANPMSTTDALVALCVCAKALSPIEYL
jgi:hypothetical protein